MKFRVGYGFDVHSLEKGRELWIGGVLIPSAKGAVGHSDADVLIHALCDALLGASNNGDIGTHFPDTDQRWKGMASKYFLKEVMNMLKSKGWKVENVDCTLCLEEPKIAPYIPTIKQMLASIMLIDVGDISIKATTSEKLGYVGRSEGVNASAIALISKND